MAQLFADAENAAIQEACDGRPATYTPPGGDPVACHVIVDDMVDVGEIGGVKVAGETFEIAFAPGEVAAPVRDAVVAVTGGDTYVLGRPVSRIPDYEVVFTARKSS